MKIQGISLNPLPDNTTVISLSSSLVQDHFLLFCITVVTIVVLIILVVILYGNILLRRRAEHSLQESEEKYRSLFEKSPDAIFLITSRGNTIMDVNKAAAQLLGIERTDIIGKHPALFSPELQPDGTSTRVRIDAMMARTLSDGSAYFEIVRKHRDQSVFPAEVWLSCIPFRETPLILAVWRDISERKKIHELLIQTEKMMSLGGLAAGMAHEINNPLAGIVQNAQLLEQRLLKDIKPNQEAALTAGIDLQALNHYLMLRRIPGILTDLHSAGMRAADIVASMLSFSRQSASGKIIDSIPRLMEAVIDIARNDYDLKKKFDFKTLPIKKNYDPGIPDILCQPGRLQQVFLNILKNGAESMYEKKKLNPGFQPCFTITIRYQNQAVVLSIRDNGLGISQEIRRKLFEPFFTTKAPGSGTGLGMSISYFIITEQHQGRLEVESIPGEYAAFTIILPVQAPIEGMNPHEPERH